MNADWAVQNDHERWIKANKKPKKKPAAKKKGSKKKLKKNEEAAYHFIAYVPVNGEVWKLDGLQRQPAKLGRLPRLRT